MTGRIDRGFVVLVILCAGVLAVAVGMVAVYVVGWLDSKDEGPADPTVWPCRNEDGSGQPDGEWPCLWDAKTMGNGQGRSFLMLGPNTRPIYIED